jgi:hypothetical protein
VIVPIEGGAAWEEDGEVVATALLERDGDRLLVRSLSETRPGAEQKLVTALADMANASVLVGPDEAWTLPLDSTPAPHETFTLAELEAAVRSAWSAETADEPETWSPDNPARNHCDVTALVVRDLLGGEILIANVIRDGRRVERHAWNRLPSGIEVDLTREQFRNGEHLGPAAPGEPMSLRRTPERYELFAARVRAGLSATRA